MTIGADLWTFVKSVSAPALLRQLTNPENSPPNTIDDTVGTSAASAASGSLALSMFAGSVS